MKRAFIILLGLIISVGCAASKEKIAMYKKNPEKLLKDPAFNEYETELNRVESRYLNKEISYAEYQQKREELDQDYARTIKERSGHVAPEDL